ncbi:MAG: hypothetical protein ABFR02_04035 [Campylobacterota bacterium]
MKSMTVFTLLVLALLTAGCTQEQQNKMSRDIQNWTGTNGVLDIYAGEKLVQRFVKVDKLTTGVSRDDGQQRAYRYSYGFYDENQNYKVDEGEKKLYFEVSNYTNYVFYENPQY